MSHTNNRIRVAVIFGGRSAEHPISCISAGSVINALDPSRYDVVPIGIATDGRWVLENPDRLRMGADGTLPRVTGEVSVGFGDGPELFSRHGDTITDLGRIDVVFPVMHGPWGQDGTLQGLLELAGIRYVGAGVLSSAVGTDKVFMKRILAAHGIPTVAWVEVLPGAWQRDPDTIRAAVDRLGYPVFVKPARAGSSFGITKVERPADLDAAIVAAGDHDPKVLVEAAASGAREIEIGVLERLDGGRPQTSVSAEISVDPSHEFYDFEAKYLPAQNTTLQVPARLDDPTQERARELAVATFAALDVEGLARVDFFVLPDGEVLVNELETMPGFTATSMFPRMWAESGLDYRQLVDRLVRLALQRDIGLR